jgi:hypothetical protein
LTIFQGEIKNCGEFPLKNIFKKNGGRPSYILQLFEEQGIFREAPKKERVVYFAGLSISK